MASNGKNGTSGTPAGHHTVSPHLVIRGCAEAIDWYKKAFGTTEVMRMPGPDGKLMHAEIKLGDSLIFLADEFPEMGCRSPLALGGSPVTIHFYVADVDAVFNQAVAAGAKVGMPPMDMFWGDRYCKVTDPFGHDWSIATQKEALSPAQMAERGQAAMAEMAECAGK